MASIDRTVVSLRIIGDDLDPDEVTRVLGGSPSFAHKKGDIVRNDPRAKERIARFGMWSRRAGDRRPEDVEGQVQEILSALTSDIAAWRALTKRFRTDVFCGLFMRHVNEGFSLRPATMEALSSRGIEIGFDVYGPSPDEKKPNKAPEPTP